MGTIQEKDLEMKSFVCFVLIFACAVQADEIRDEFEITMKKLQDANMERKSYMSDFFKSKEDDLFEYRESNRRLVYGTIDKIKEESKAGSKKCQEITDDRLGNVTRQTSKFIEAISNYENPPIHKIKTDNDDFIILDRRANNELSDRFGAAQTDEERKAILDEAQQKLSEGYSDEHKMQFRTIIAFASCYSFYATTHLMSQLIDIRAKSKTCA